MKRSSPSPFESKSSIPKFSVLNKQTIGIKGKPSASKSRALEARKNAFLPALKQIGRSAEFVDRRFGEKKQGMTMDEKMLERFRRERMKKKKPSFNLEDDGGDGLTLTHRGRTLDEDNLSDEPLHSDEDDLLPSFFANHQREREDDFAQNGELTKEEVMKQVMAKSKLARFQRQQANSENASLCDDLDASFSEILPALKSLPVNSPLLPTVRKDDDYDSLVKQLAWDKKSKPTDRTGLELAQKEKALSKEAALLEGKRKRMEDTEGDALDEQGDEDDERERSLKLVMSQADHLFSKTLAEGKEAQEAYSQLRALVSTRSVIPVARLFRLKLSSLRARLSKKKKTTKDDLMLFHLIGKLFSTSDRHHIVATPALLLLDHIFQNEVKHQRSLLFLMQTCLSYLKDSKRVMPSFISSLLKLIPQKLDGEPRAITFEEAIKTEELTPEDLNAHLSFLLSECKSIYGAEPFFVETFAPFLPLLPKSLKSSFKNAMSSLWKTRVPLTLYKKKALSLPMLTPDLSHEGTREERETSRLQKALKREQKGAKRELRRDSAFMSQQKLDQRLESDRKYQERLRQVMGTIANDSREPKRPRHKK